MAGEKRARLTDEVVSAVGQAGLFRLFAPQEVGGLEASPPTALAAIEAVSTADPAVGWCIGNSQPICLAAGFLGQKSGKHSSLIPIATLAFQQHQMGGLLQNRVATG